MSRIDRTELAFRIEVALGVAPATALDALHVGDANRRREAKAELARHVAERLDCFVFEYQEWPPTPGQRSLFAE